MPQQDITKREEVEQLYSKVNYRLDDFDPVTFLQATRQLHEQGLIGPFDFEFESETEVLKAVTCVSITTPEGSSYNIKYEGELSIS